MEFREPPSSGGVAHSRYDDVVVALQARPGEWACVASGVSHNALSSPRQALKERGCDVTVRKNGSAVEVFARWPL